MRKAVILIISFFLFSAAYINTLGEAVERNKHSIQYLKEVVLSSDYSSAKILSEQCSWARKYYEQGRIQDVVDLLIEPILSTPDEVLKITQCRPAMNELIASLGLLGRSEDELQVSRRLVVVYPESRDWSMHFAQLVIGDDALENGNWQAALDHFVIAYECALLTSADQEMKYEKRVWEKIRKTSIWITSEGYMPDALEYITNKSANEARSTGWEVVAGLFYEQHGTCQEAMTKFYSAQGFSPQAAYLRQYIQDLEQICAP